MLHIVKSIASLPEAVQHLHADDALLLTEEAVYAANSQHFAHSFIASFKKTVFALENDTQARGLAQNETNSIHFVDFDGFVLLSERHSQSITWE